MQLLQFFIHNLKLYMKNLKPILSLIFLIITINCFNLTFDQFIKSTPETQKLLDNRRFGLITVTHARKGNYVYFRRHIDRYAQMDCPQMAEISVVWNNDVTPQSQGFVQDSSWKRPVYFVKTQYNSMDFRYTLPEKSKAKVYFEIDDDVIITCEQLRKSFVIWRKNAIGDIAPIMTYAPRGFDFNSRTQTFNYKDPEKNSFFSMNLVGVAWISRFFFQIYNSQRIWQIIQMRKMVKQKNNCDDIALNFLVNYFFPQLIPMYISGQFNFQIHPASQSLTQTHYSFRNQCLQEFTEILGYNPLRYISKAPTQELQSKKRYMSQAKKYVLYLRRKQIAERFLESQVNKKQVQIPFNFINQLQRKLEDDVKSLGGSRNFSVENQKKQEQKEKENLIQEIQRLKEQYSKNSQQLNKKLNEISQLQKKITQNSPNNPNASPPSASNNPQQTTPNSQETILQIILLQLKQSFLKLRTVSLILGIFVCCMFVYMLSDCAELCREQGQRQIWADQQKNSMKKEKKIRYVGRRGNLPVQVTDSEEDEQEK